MILPALALALLAAGAPVNAQRSSVLVNRLASQGSGWRVMSSAANQLSKRKLSKADVNALRKLLAAELEQRPLRLAGSTEHVCARHEPWQCSVDIGECLPRAGFIAIVFEKRGDLARQALPELRALAERTDAGSARMIALVAITAAGDPKARDAAVTLLRSRDYDCVSAGLGLFAGRALSAEDRRELEHALLGGYFESRCEVARALGELRDPRFVPALVRALQLPDHHLQREAVDALAQIGPSAAEARDVLEATASCHESRALRARARRAYRKIARGSAPPKVPCPSTLATATGGVLRQGDHELSFTRVGEESAACNATLSVKRGEVRDIGAGPYGCLTAANVGEWGGTIYVTSEKRTQEVFSDPFINTVASFRVRDDVYALSWVRHMSEDGQLLRLSRDGGRTWTPEKLASLPAAPIAFTHVGETVIVGVETTSDLANCTGSVRKGSITWLEFREGQPLRVVPDDKSQCGR